MYIDFIIKAFLWICCLFSRSSGFRICQSSSSKTEKLSCISRASCAQAPRKQKNAFGWSKKGGPQNRWSLPWKESSQNARGICPHNGGEKADNALQWRKGKRKQGAMSCPVAVVQLRLRIRLTEKKSAQVHCCRKIEALVFLLANSMIVRQGMFFNYEKRRHARKCVIWPILGTSFSTNRHICNIYICIYICIYTFYSIV